MKPDILHRKYVKTPAYMSPEQASGEGSHLDAGSDIDSLGVVFYELLAGYRPFLGETQAELLEQVSNHEPRPLRECDANVPAELERICHKALAKCADKRYPTAQCFADDLRQFLDQQTVAAPRSVISIFVGAAVVAILEIGLLGLWSQRGPPPEVDCQTGQATSASLGRLSGGIYRSVRIVSTHDQPTRDASE